MVGITKCPNKNLNFMKYLGITCVIMLSSTLIGYIFGTIVKAASQASKQAVVHSDEIVTVYDRMQHVMPTYYQTDPAWAEEPYLGGTIGTHGCGLTCAAMAYEYISGNTMTPSQLALEVGDTCSEAGVNDMYAFSEWLAYHTDVTSVSEQIWTLDGIRQADLTNAIIFCGLSGGFGTTWYGGHVVLMFNATDDGVMVRDPASADNTRFWSWEEFELVDATYFYIVRYE